MAETAGFSDQQLPAAPYNEDFNQVVEPRDKARERGGFVMYGYTPRFPEGFNQSDPSAVSEYLSRLLTDEEAAYIGPFGTAPLHSETVSLDNKAEHDKQDDIVENYDNFRDSIAEIRNNATKHHIGSGTHSEVFKFSKGNKEYVARLIKPIDNRAEVLHSHIAAGAKAQGISGLEKIVAGSYEEGVVVSEFVTGNHLQDLTVEQVAQISDAQLAALVEARLQAMSEGIQFDNHPANILYDADEGFTDIDYHFSTNPNKTVERLDAMKTVLGSLDLTESELYETDSEKRAQHGAVKIAILKRLNDYMKESFNSDEYGQLWNELVRVVSWRKAGHSMMQERQR